MVELSEEEVLSNDKDPLAAIAEIRREEGVPEEDIIIVDSEVPSEESDIPKVEDGQDELDSLSEDADDKPIEKDTDVDEEGTQEETVLADGDENLDKEEQQDDVPKKDLEDKEATVDSTAQKFTANGQEFEFTQEEMLEQFGVIFGQAMDYTQKTQKMAPYRKMISALESEGVTTEQLNLALDALKGNKQAIQTLMENNKIDAYDLTNNEEGENTPYTPSDYGKNDIQLGIDDITSRIEKDEEYKITVDVIDNQWDQDSRTTLSSNPSMIQGLHNDIKSGVYDKIAPVAMKIKVLDGNTKSDVEYYMLAGEKVLSEEKQNSVKTEKTVDDMNKEAQAVEDEFDQASSEAKQKRSASPTRTRADRKGVIDYLDDDDEDFDAWYKKLQASH